MTHPSPADRRRLIEALGLGPVYVRRTHTKDRDAAEGDASTADWETLRRMVASGGACGLAGEAVADGATRADWLVIGAPVAGEANGDAFAGRAGRLLDAMLAAIGLGRDRGVAVATLLHGPAHDAGHRCLERQIALLGPRIIVVFGADATRALLPDAPDFDGVRGKARSLAIGGREVAVVPTFHPAQLLDDGAAKARAWSDLCLARAIFDELPAHVSA